MTSKPTEATYGFDTILETAIYSNFIHALAILIDLFGKVESPQQTIQNYSGKRFTMFNSFKFGDGQTATIKWGTLSNQFKSKCEFSSDHEVVTVSDLDTIRSMEIGKGTGKVNQKDKEFIEHKLSYSADSHDVARYSKAVDIWLSDIQKKTNLSSKSIFESVEIYRIIEEILARATK